MCWLGTIRTYQPQHVLLFRLITVHCGGGCANNYVIGMVDFYMFCWSLWGGILNTPLLKIKGLWDGRSQPALHDCMPCLHFASPLFKNVGLMLFGLCQSGIHLKRGKYYSTVYYYRDFSGFANWTSVASEQPGIFALLSQTYCVASGSFRALFADGIIASWSSKATRRIYRNPAASARATNMK